MKNSTQQFLCIFICITALFFTTGDASASHAQSADLTYTCIGGNQYQVKLSFYRDCAGVGAPQTVNIDVSSIVCNQNFTATLNQANGTGIDVTPVCPNMVTNCSGGQYPGVQEWVYIGNITLPAACSDWVMSFTLCCRNAAISTINNPGGENIYVEANLDNDLFPCNSSPQFSNKPIPFICVNQTYCFNHGAIDPDGDSLVYALVPCATGPTTNVTYLGGYSPTQPIASVPAATINSATGDICVTPTQLEVGVMAVKVTEYRNGEYVGSVIRDIQIRVVSCTNTLPWISGINGSNNFTATVCAGGTFNFDIFSFDNDAANNLTLTWNNGITGGNFSTSGGSRPTGTFTWTPTQNQISGTPYCFTVTVSDDDCPLNGSQTYSFCLTVTGFGVTVNTTSANCGASNGSATAVVTGAQNPITYNWSSGSANNFANGLQGGNYSVTVSDGSGCVITNNFSINQGSAPGNTQVNVIPVSCFGGNNGAATANHNGGQQPYSYQWSTGDTTQTITGLSAGNYSVTVTTGNGCIILSSVIIPQPAAPLSLTSSQQDVSCFNGNNGNAAVNVSGGSGPYYYTWNTNPQQNNSTAVNLTAGSFTATIIDSEGCTIAAAFDITEPAPLSIINTDLINVTCFGLSNGSAGVAVTGGVGPYSYSWSNNPGNNNSFISNVTAGNYIVNVTDNNNCPAQLTIAINQPQQLLVTVPTATPVSCYGLNNGAAQSAATGGTVPHSYSWNTFPVQTTPMASSLSGGTYTVSVTDVNNCAASAQAIINEPAPLTITTSGGTTICPGQFTPISVNASGGNGGYNYNWSNGLNNNPNQSVSPGANTTYTVNVTDMNGCTTPLQSITVVVNDINLVNFAVSATPQLCAGETGMVSATLTGGTGTYTVTWNNGLPNGYGPYAVTPSGPVNYTATLTDVCGNTRTESDFTDVFQLPQISLTPVSATDCGQANVTFVNSTNNPAGTQYDWDFGDGSASTLANPSHDYTLSGNYPVTLTATSPEGCVNTGNTICQIVVYPQTVARFDATPGKTSIFNPQVKFTDQSVNATIYDWNLGDGTLSTLQSPVHRYEAIGTYTVILITNNSYNCPDTATDIIVILPEFTFFVPNAFTPDGDGINDTFFGKGEYIENFEMFIFDRWGENIFTSTSMSSVWDGTYRGSEQPKPDVYVYKIKVKDSIKGDYHFYEGHVTLVK